MVDTFRELNLTEAKSVEEMELVLKEKLGIGLLECAQALSVSLVKEAEGMIDEFFNIAPHNDYSKLLEDKSSMIKFLQEEACKPENWQLQFMEVRKEKDQLIEMVFFNSAVDGGDILKGFVFLGLSGKIRHAFVQVHS